MTKVQFYDRAEDHKLRFAVIVTKTDGHWVFCKHKERDTLEVPGGHRERERTSWIRRNGNCMKKQAPLISALRLSVCIPSRRPGMLTAGRPSGCSSMPK